MTPATLSLIIEGVGAAVDAFPKVVEVADAGKKLITAVFNAGGGSAEIQNELHAWVDARGEARLRGDVPPTWVPRPDPSTPSA